MPLQTKYRLLEHTADLRYQIFGRSFRELLQNATIALSDTLTDWKSIRKNRSRKIQLKAENQEQLLVRLLQELLFLFDAKQFLTRRLEFQSVSDTMIVAKAWGETFETGRHPPKTEIKAVTYHQLKIQRQKSGWIAEIVFDV